MSNNVQNLEHRDQFEAKLINFLDKEKKKIHIIQQLCISISIN